MAPKMAEGEFAKAFIPRQRASSPLWDAPRLVLDPATVQCRLLDNEIPRYPRYGGLSNRRRSGSPFDTLVDELKPSGAS